MRLIRGRARRLKYGLHNAIVYAWMVSPADRLGSNQLQSLAPRKRSKAFSSFKLFQHFYTEFFRFLLRQLGFNDLLYFRAHLRQGSSGCLAARERSEEHTSELQSQSNIVCRL